MLIDAHCHLTDERLNRSTEAVVQRAFEHGVHHMINCGTNPADWPLVLDQAARFPSLIPAVGVHPWFIRDLPDHWAEQLETFLRSHPALLIGETGLDALRNPPDFEHSKKVFRRQIELAVEFRRPLIIHCVRAWGPLLEALKGFGPLPTGFMLHAFSGAPEIIRELLPLNAFFSFSGAVTQPGNHRVRNAVRLVPEDRLLIETDAPDFLPAAIPDRALPNEPANLPLILDAVAELRNCSAAELAERTTANARRFLCPAL